MKAGIIIIIVLAAIGVSVVGLGFTIVYRIKHSALAGLFEKDIYQSEEHPRQLQDLTKTYEQLIKRQFPEFDSREFLSQVEAGLLHLLNSLEAKYLDVQDNFSPNLSDYLQETIEDLKSKGETWHYDDIYIHNSAIARYEHGQGSWIIIAEIAIEYASWTEKNAQLMAGSKEKGQHKYEVQVLYVQDASKFGESSMFGHNCPNCGAPVVALGKDKYCRYCGTGLTEVNMRIWLIDKYKRI